tara:strand:- start:1825 stop:2439 length:615 start_codon:yes stop_codon:yes gene_type:complete
MMMETPARSSPSGIATLDSPDLEIPLEIGLSGLDNFESEFTDEDAMATILRFLKEIPEDFGADPDYSVKDYALGAADVVADAASALGSPLLDAPHKLIQTLTADPAFFKEGLGIPLSKEEMRNTERIKEASERRLEAMNYEPRTALGQEMSDSALRGIGSFLAPALDAAEGATDYWLFPDLKSLWESRPKREKLAIEALLEMIP